MIKVGRYTAAFLLLVVGGLLLLEQFTSIYTLPIILDWWPVLFILLGLEYIYFSSKYKSSDRQLRLDSLGILLSVLISVVIVGSVHASSAIDFIKGLNISTFYVDDSDEEDGVSIPVIQVQSNDSSNMSSSANVNSNSFELEKTYVLLSADTKNIQLKNVNGGVNIHSGDVQSIEIVTHVVVPHVGAAEAKRIAEESRIHYTAGKDIQISAEGQTYSSSGINKQKAIMNLEVTVPKSLSSNYQIEVINGQVRAEGIPVQQVLRTTVTNGSIEITNIDGSVITQTTNGEIKLDNIRGNAQAITTTGVVKVSNISGDLKAESTVGAINISEAGGVLQAHTTTGKISIKSGQINGAWDIDNSIGSVSISLPDNADFRVEGNITGGLNSDFPDIRKNDGLQGKNGAGTHVIRIKTIGQVSITKNI
ncbi:DUF4097 family beta strand repeat-containing protein [Paenibacillus sp. KN14-4R]|uniref:DUF4097 family beta strand repeat-containing protein n=1 Tax=Paenibacillus sp. KN14-4R TaxID=3445773 RepID=UPI003F9FB1CD